MAVNMVREEPFNMQKYSSQSVKRQDDMLNGYHKKIDETRGKLDKLYEKSGLEEEKKRELERQLKSEIAELNRKLKQCEADRRKQEISNRDIEESTVETIEFIKPSQVERTEDKVAEDQKQDRNEKEDAPAKQEGQSSAVEEKIMHEIISAQAKLAALASDNAVDDRMENQRSVAKSEIALDRLRGQDTTVKEKKLEDITVPVRTQHKTMFQNNSAQATLKGKYIKEK